MLLYFVRRLAYMAILLLVLTVVTFVIIQLPPGDYVTYYTSSDMGYQYTAEDIINLRAQYGLDSPLYAQYFLWMRKMLRGNLGISFTWDRPVVDLLMERLPLTVAISILSLLFTYVVAVPIGIYSATHQYSVGDYIFTVIGFAGLATPNFLLAILLMFVFYKYLGLSVGGLFSAEYMAQDFSLGKLVDLLKHLITPIIVVGTAGTAGLIRVMRACLLDELQKQYVITARAKGVAERRLLFKYPVRVSINPLISTVGYLLPYIVSGTIITAIVLNLPTIGPLLYGALKSQDVFLAGSIVMVLSFLTIVGTLISDMLLVWLDPRIRYEK